MGRPPTRSMLLLVLASLLLVVPTASAALRNPQVPVSGTALASFFAAQGQDIAVMGDQQELATLDLPAYTAYEVRAVLPGAGTVSFGGYNGLAETPPLYAIYPGAASSGWYSVCSFREYPNRLVVNLFDEHAVIQGTSTYLDADRTAFGFYTLGPSGAFFTQDERNLDGLPRILAYSGTGAYSGSTWLACETSPGANGDFADFVVLVAYPLTPVETRHTTWGTLKQLYR